MDPLAQLQDIQTPEQINNLPIAMGWWLLLLIAVIIISLVIKKIMKQQRLKKVQKQAIIKVKQADISLDDTLITLKWAAMHYFSRGEIASLSGNKLKAFLLATLPEKYHLRFNQLADNQWSTLYQATPSDDCRTSIQQATLLWLQKALPAKVIKTSGGQHV